MVTVTGNARRPCPPRTVLNRMIGRWPKALLTAMAALPRVDDGGVTPKGRSGAKERRSRLTRRRPRDTPLAPTRAGPRSPSNTVIGATSNSVSTLRRHPFREEHRVFRAPAAGVPDAGGRQRGLRQHTADDAVDTQPGATPIPGHQARDWTFFKDTDDGTSVAYALVSWDAARPADYLMAGWWAQFPRPALPGPVLRGFHSIRPRGRSGDRPVDATGIAARGTGYLYRPGGRALCLCSGEANWGEGRGCLCARRVRGGDRDHGGLRQEHP